MSNFDKKYDITHTNDISGELETYIRQHKPSKIIIITDKNCGTLCLEKIELSKNDGIKKFVLSPGEENKSLKTVSDIWKFLLENKVDRSSLIINTGGGLVSDTGGFAASTFKRGVPFINIPTTLLAQIDASAGGKTGINFGGYKNQIGTFSLPEKVLISDIFFETLPEEEFLSGFGEMIKHTLIYSKDDYEELIYFIKNDFKNKNYDKLKYLVKKSVKIKEHFVKNDFKDKGIRNTLNFGHTFGHALESYFFNKGTPVKHGIAVAFGIVYELWLSAVKKGFDIDLFNKIKDDIFKIFGDLYIPDYDFNKIFNYMKQDKKNKGKNILCTLLTDIGFFENQNIITQKDIYESLNFLNSEKSLK